MTISALILAFLTAIAIFFIYLVKNIEKNIGPAAEYNNDNSVDCIEFPIDIVITWVDGTDEARNKLRILHKNQTPNIAQEATSSRRYINHDELKYLLRSINRYIPWAHRIHVISSDQPPPDWLVPNEIMGFNFDTPINQPIQGKPILRWVNDKKILSEDELPTFNSHALESAVYKLQDLTEHFIYFCDDMFVTRPLHPAQLYDHDGKPKICPNFWKTPYRIAQGVHAKTWRKLWSVMTTEYPGKDKWMNAHVATPLNKQLMVDTEKFWGKEWLTTRANKFRAGHDVQPIAASVIYGQVNNMIKRNTELSSGFVMFKDLYLLNRICMAIALSTKPHLFCINNDLERPDKFGIQLKSYLNKLFPHSSCWEKDPRELL